MLSSSANDDVFEDIVPTSLSPTGKSLDIVQTKVQSYLGPSPWIGSGEPSRFHVTSGVTSSDRLRGMERRRAQFPQFMRPSLAAKMREIGSSSPGRGDMERDRYGDRDRERERDRDRERFQDRDRDRFVERDREPRAALPSQSGGGEEPELLVRQNHDLRRRLDEESQSYKRRLETYKQAQAHQAALVSRLQAKILQYKQRCTDLEGQIEPSGHLGDPDTPLGRGSIGGLPPPPLDDQDLDPDAALRLLDDERRKNERLKLLNSQLKQQLDESHGTNENLTGDLQKLHADWERLRDELLAKEEEWKEEEHAFHDYYTSEHSRLLGLWRDVVCVKRLFAEMQTCTERDLGRMRDEMTNSARDLDRACAGLTTCAILSAKSEEKHQLQREQDEAELRAQLHAMRAEHESALVASRQKDDRIQELSKEIRALEERCAEAEQNVTQVVRMQAEAELLQGALRDIAHAVIQDAEARDEGLPPAPPHVHLTPPGAMPPRSPKRGTGRTPTSPAFAESTISAVQAALHKYQLQIHELQVKLQTHKEQCSHLKKQFDTADEAQHGLSARVADLTNQLDAARAQITQMTQEKELFLKSLDTLRSDKGHLEKTRLEMSAVLESLSGDYDKLQKTNTKLQKLADCLEDEKLFLQSEVDRMSREAELREQVLRSEEDRGSRLKEKLLIAQEELSKTCLERDMLLSQKMEADNLLSQLEKGKGDIEIETERLLLEKGDLQDSLEKCEHRVSVLEHEKRRLLDDVKRLEEERNCLHNLNADQLSDLTSLKKELLQAEQMRMDLEAEKIILLERIKFLEIEKDKISVELAAVSRDRNELNNQLLAVSRKRETLNEENLRIRQRLEQASETNARINRNLEDLLKENEEKQVILESNEKDIQRLQEQLASLRSEKEALEAVLFDTQTNLEATEIKRFQIEKDYQDLLVKQESLRGQVARLTKDLDAVEKRARESNSGLMQRMQAQEAEFQQLIASLKKFNEDNSRKLNEEKEQVRLSLEKRLQTSLQQLGGEKDQELLQLHERIETLQAHIENLCQQHEEVLLRAENDKQQALLLAHHDQQALSDKLEAIVKELEEEKSAVDRVKRDSAGRAEQDRLTINSLRDELGKLKTRLEELRIYADEEKARLETKIDETKAERDASLMEGEELRVQINLAEDRNDGLQNQLQDTLRRLKECETTVEGLRKELTDVRRQLSDSNFEKEKYNNTNKELREHIKRTEQERRETQRALDEAFQKIASLDDVKGAVESERARLQGQLKEQEKQAMQLQQALQHAQDDLGRARNATSNLATEDKERQARLFSEIEEKERAHQELHQLKKQIVELDGGLEVARQEMLRLRARADDEDQRWRHREQELLLRLEDVRTRERKLEDQKHNLEVCLADATQQIQELKARLGGTEGRVKALESQLQQLEAAKKMAEQKLTSVASTLKRIAGVQLDGSVSLPFKLLSPSRRWSPARSREVAETSKTAQGVTTSTSHEHHRGHGHTHCHDNRDAILDVDPEAVRKGVRTLMQQVAQIERERDDLKTSLTQMKRQLSEASEIQSKGDNKLGQVLQNLRVLQEEKGSLEAKLGQKQAALQAQGETVAARLQEVNELRDKVTCLELSVRSAAEEKSQYEDKIEKLKNNLTRLEGEKRGLQEELSRAESRATKLELHRMALEGDLQRVQMLLQDKDVQIHKAVEKCEAQSRNLTSLEERCVSLKATIEQLNASLERASGGESDLRSEVAALQRTLQEANTNVAAGSEKMKQLQKSLNVSENERRVLAERLDATQQSLGEAKRAQQNLTDQVQRLQTELSNNEVKRSGLETQLRHASNGDRWNDSRSSPPEDDQMRNLRREKAEFRAKIDSLNEKVRQLETEKRTMERTMSKANVTRSKSFERAEKGSAVDELSNGKLEQDNRELRLKIRRLESQLAEKEAELVRLRNHKCSDSAIDRNGEVERSKAAQLQAERLLEAREQSHRQQVIRLENQVQLLREQLNQEVKRRQLYVLRSSRAGREVQQMRQALGDSLRTVAQDPQLDSLLLEHETRRLDSTMASSQPLALPPPDYTRPQ